MEKRIEYDEMKVQKCVSCLLKCVQKCVLKCGGMVKFLSKSWRTLSLSSGKQAPEDLKQDLLKAKKIGEKQLQDFIDNRVLSDRVGFYEPIKCLKLKAFRSIKVKKQAKSREKNTKLNQVWKRFLDSSFYKRNATFSFEKFSVINLVLCR